MQEKKDVHENDIIPEETVEIDDQAEQESDTPDLLKLKITSWMTNRNLAIGAVAALFLIFLLSLFVSYSDMKQENQLLKDNIEKLANQLETQEDWKTLVYGTAGQPLSPLYPEMVVNWHEESAYMPQEPTVYLTFDDGPSKLTPQVLNILDAYGIKATFFVLGKTDETLKSYYQEILDRGHTLGMHSYSHNYNAIYKDLDGYLNDFAQIYYLLVEKTGVEPTIFRFPGGSTNSYLKKYETWPTIKAEMNNRGFVYYDWNVSSGDAVGRDVSAQEIVDNVVSGVSGKTYAVVLMHDSGTKQSTIDALPGMIETLAAMGYKFDKITPEMVPVQFK